MASELTQQKFSDMLSLVVNFLAGCHGSASWWRDCHNFLVDRLSFMAPLIVSCSLRSLANHLKEKLTRRYEFGR